MHILPCYEFTYPKSTSTSTIFQLQNEYLFREGRFFAFNIYFIYLLDFYTVHLDPNKDLEISAQISKMNPCCLRNLILRDAGDELSQGASSESEKEGRSGP